MVNELAAQLLKLHRVPAGAAPLVPHVAVPRADHDRDQPQPVVPAALAQDASARPYLVRGGQLAQRHHAPGPLVHAEQYVRALVVGQQVQYLARFAHQRPERALQVEQHPVRLGQLVARVGQVVLRQLAHQPEGVGREAPPGPVHALQIDCGVRIERDGFPARPTNVAPCGERAERPGQLVVREVGHGAHERLDEPGQPCILQRERLRLGCALNPLDSVAQQQQHSLRV
uniref:Uncharacterized protein n=1 Tax=Anopheles coluzzii TaxID=1518534 RepID=A0A8W7PJT4_ANOCL